MTMDFSRLHTYTPPQCAPENTGYTYSLSSSYSTVALEFEKAHQIAPVFNSPRMSRRSLRLQTTGGLYGNDRLADSQNHSSGGSSRTESWMVRSRKQQSASSSLSLNQSLNLNQNLSLNQSQSQSLNQTPRKTLSFSTTNTPSTGCTTASDASLLSSILDQSGLRQRSTTTTTTDGYWGSDQDTSLKGRSARTDHSSTGANGGVNTVSHSHTMVANGYICKDCSIHSERKEALTTYSSSSSSQAAFAAAAAATFSSSSSQAASAAAAASALSSSSSSQAASAAAAAAAISSSSASSSSLYCTVKSQRSKTGLLVSVSNTCVHYSRRALAPIVSLVTLLFQNVLWLGTRARSHTGKGVLASLLDRARRAVSSSVSRVSWLFKQTTLHRMMGYRANGYEGKAHSSYCGSMNVKDHVMGDGRQHFLNGSLCDDCKGKQHLETNTLVHSHTQTSRTHRLLGGLWTLIAYTGYCLLQPGYYVVRAGVALGSAVGSAVRSVAQRLLSVLWLFLGAPGKAARRLLWCLGTGWYQLVSLMSLFNVFFLTRCLPRMWKLLLFLLPLLLLLWLWFWVPSSFLSYLPAINLTEWRSKVVSPFTLSSFILTPALVLTPATPLEQTPPAPPGRQAQPVLPPIVTVDTESLERLERVEHGLTLLWERVEQGDQRQEQHHGDTLAQYTLLREQLDSQTDRDSLGLWVSGLLEHRITLLRGELEQQEASHRAQTEEQRVQQQQSQETRLAELEGLLQVLATKTEAVQQKREQRKEETEETATPAPASVPVSVGVDQEAHAALLAEVQRLEGELGRIRGDLQGVMGCQGKCEQLNTIQETVSTQVSAQVRRELRALFYGSVDQTHQGEPDIPEGLLQWLSSRYVNGADLQALLTNLEFSILRNVSLQLEQSRAEARTEAEARAAVITTQTQAITQSVQHTAVGRGLSEEQVQLIVQNALKLYSQDRTGLVDYALESGGGSILSTRCSETYETKTALMSLFSVPLWYFSQSPRVAIQPDMYPGNCWAFKGSHGYLVIRLSLRILPTAFCLEHIPKALSPTGNITSAPRNFTVYGLDDEYQEEGKLLGQYTYQEDGDSMQNFPVMEKNERAFQIIEVRVLTNWGHPEYTCLYRFRVHGEPRIQ
ncbi:SUN domain-containing protein 1-like isoform X2 [Salvelinus fontinalis]|uniref:SUN domain-containing protein 1-like isoform X2 n=1 Tax=Salvelinus fontinalis TaxID=8038 RepID=UPI002484DFAC|nr:SUN domain-containing protein 1-like isoform X2 [Salvelinus fontinalis]